MKYWTESRESLKVQNDIQEKVDSIAKDIVSGCLLIHETPEKLAIEYARKVGEIQGLLQLKKMIEEAELDE